jgi:hypothetical protein
MLVWERNWRGAGVVFAVLIIIASVIYGSAPKSGAGADEPFGLWRADLISSRFFSAGVLAVVLVLLGGTTWATNGFWAPDGGYALVSRLVLVAWIVVISGFLYMQSPSAAKAPERVAVPAP